MREIGTVRENSLPRISKEDTLIEVKFDRTHLKRFRDEVEKVKVKFVRIRPNVLQQTKDRWN